MGDILYVNSLGFLATKSKKVKFSTVQFAPKQTIEILLRMIRQILVLYRQGSLVVRELQMDGQFEPLREPLADLGVLLNTTSASEHVPMIERHIRTLKDHVRSTMARTPFEKIPPRMTIECVKGVNMWMNCLPPKDGVSTTLAPRTIVTGLTMKYGPHMLVPYGSYAHVHNDTDNTMRRRTTAAIALRPMGNRQGGHYFLSLRTGRMVSARTWTILPMPDIVRTRVAALARAMKPPTTMDLRARDGSEAARRRPILEDDGGTVDGPTDEDDDETQGEEETPTLEPERHLTEDEGLQEPEVDDEGDAGAERGTTGTNANPHDTTRLTTDDVEGTWSRDQETGDLVDHNGTKVRVILHDPTSSAQPNTDQPTQPEETNGSAPPTTETPPNDTDPTSGDLTTSTHGPPPEHPPTPDNTNNCTINRAVSMGEEHTKARSAYNLREREKLLTRKDLWQKRGYTCLTATEPTEIWEAVMTQVSMNRGLQLFGEDGAKAVRKEMEQLHRMRTLKPMGEPTREEKRQALRYLMYLKKKNCGRIKGRGCADGRRQRETTPKSSATSPTVSIEAVFMTAMIDASEGRDIAVVDIPGAYLHADMDELVIVRFEGKMAEMLVLIDPKIYKPYVQVDRSGKKVLYAKLRKALYGCLRSGLLFWKNLTDFLKQLGFCLNPYDTCVANKIIRGTQCTIVWHVDDLKISHLDREVVTEVIELLTAKYGKLQVNRGKVHDYLGMKLDFTQSGSVKIVMEDYVEKIISEAGEEFKGNAVTPAKNNLFNINNVSPYLDDAKAQFFHTLTAKLLFLAKRARPDILTAVAFLTTRVKNPTAEDQEKLKRVIMYLQFTPKLCLKLECQNTKELLWRADGSHGVHPDMRGQTGGMFTMGKGSVYSTSTRQKLNTKSSTETELVAAGEVLTQALWSRNFLHEQLGDKGTISLMQDNMSAIILEKNGIPSSGKNMRHLSIRAFWIADHFEKGEVKIDYEPTEEMVADFFTKPLQGSAFHKFRRVILNEE